MIDFSDPFPYSILFGVLIYFVFRNALGFQFAGGVMAGTLTFALCSMLGEELRR